MLRVTYLGDGITQGILLVRLEYNMKVDSRASGCVAQSLPVDWNGMPGMVDLHLAPRCDGRRDGGEGPEGHCDEEKEKK